MVSKKQPVGSAHEVLADSLETVFDEAHLFIINLHNFLQTLALPRHPFLPSEQFVPHFPKQNNVQNSFPLDTEASFLRFSTIAKQIKNKNKSKRDKLWMKLLGLHVSP